MSANIIPLETVGADIKARVEAGDKALDKAEQHFIAAGIQLAEAKKRLAETREMTWPAFLNSHCSVRRRRADELIALGEGRTSLAEMREKKARSVRECRERKKSEPALRSAEPTVSEDAGEPVYKEDARAKIADLEARLAAAEAKITELEAENARLLSDIDMLTSPPAGQEYYKVDGETGKLVKDMEALETLMQDLATTSDDDDFDPSQLWLAKDAA